MFAAHPGFWRQTVIGCDPKGDPLPGRRATRLGDLIFREIARVLLEKVKDPRVRGVTLTGIRLTDDLKTARVYYSFLGGPDMASQARIGLEKATPYIKREIAREMDLRYMPELLFVHDPSLEQGSRIERLLNRIHKEEGSP